MKHEYIQKAQRFHGSNQKSSQLSTHGKKNCSYWLAILMIIERYSILFYNNTIQLKLRKGFRNEAVAQNYVNGEHGCIS